MSANPNGHYMPRAERYAQIKALRDRGLLLREIAERTGIAISTVHALLSDPTGEKARERKSRTHGICRDCGAKTFNSGSPDVPERCRPCDEEYRRDPEYRRVVSHRNLGRGAWTDDSIRAALTSAAVGGRLSKTRYDAHRAEHGAETMPSVPALVFKYGSWRDALAAHGLRTTRENMPRAYRNRTSDEGLLCAISDCAAELGRWPSVREYGRWSRGGTGPAYNTIRQRFGSWMNALEVAMAMDGQVAA